MYPIYVLTGTSAGLVFKVYVTMTINAITRTTPEAERHFFIPTSVLTPVRLFGTVAVTAALPPA